MQKYFCYSLMNPHVPPPCPHLTHTALITVHWNALYVCCPCPQTGEGTLSQVYVRTHRLKVSGTQQTKLSGSVAERMSTRVSQWTSALPSPWPASLFTRCGQCFLPVLAHPSPWNGHALPHVWPRVRLHGPHVALHASRALICLNYHFDHLICLLGILQQHLITHRITSKLCTLAFRPVHPPSLICFPASLTPRSSQLSSLTSRGRASLSSLFLPHVFPFSWSNLPLLPLVKIILSFYYQTKRYPHSQIQSDRPSQEWFSFLCTVTTFMCSLVPGAFWGWWVRPVPALFRAWCCVCHWPFYDSHPNLKVKHHYRWRLWFVQDHTAGKGGARPSTPSVSLQSPGTAHDSSCLTHNPCLSYASPWVGRDPGPYIAWLQHNIYLLIMCSWYVT